MATSLPSLSCEVAFSRNPHELDVLVLPGTAGNYASTPDSAALSITGDLDIRAKVAPNDWTPGTNQTFVAKYVANGNQRSYLFWILTTGRLRLDWSSDGLLTSSAQSTVAPDLTDGSVKWVRVTIDVDNGAVGKTVTFYTSDDGSTWTILGAAVTTPVITSIFDSTAPLEVGANSTGTGNPFAGKVYQAEVRNGIGGTVVASPNFTTNNSPAFPDTQNNIWSLHGSANPWTDVSRYLLPGVSTSRGRQRELDEFQPGSFNLSLDNTDRRFDPTNTSSPYSPNVLPNKRMRLKASYGGKLGSALYFNFASSQYVDMGNAYNLLGNFTLEAWLKFDSDALTLERTILNKWDTVNGYLLRTTSTGRLNIIREGGDVQTQLSAPDPFLANRWYHAAAVFDGTNLSLYIDGVLVAGPSAIAAMTVAATTAPFRVGRRSTLTTYYKGHIDDVRVWSTARTEQEIRDNKDVELLGSETGLLGYYKFNDGQGTVAFDSASSPTHGLLVNGPTWANAIAPIINGYTNGWLPTWRGETAAVAVSATDGMKLLAKAAMFESIYEKEVVDDKPTAYYRLNESESTEAATDSSGNGYNAVYIGEPAMGQPDPITDDQDGAVQFAPLQYVDLHLGPRILGTGPFTAEAWFKAPISPASNPHILRQQTSTNEGWSLSIVGDKLSFQFYEAPLGAMVQRAMSTVVYEDDQWHHAVGVRHADGSITLYADGAVAATAAAPTLSVPADTNIHIGRTSTETITVDEVAIYNGVALSPARIAAHYEARNAWLNDQTGARIGKLLDAALWPTAERDLDAGQSALQSQGVLGGSALEHIQKTAESEFGAVYIARDGKVAFRERHAILKAPYTTSTATLADDGTGYQFADPTLEYDDLEIRNDIRIQREGGVAQYVRDATSIATYGLQSYSRSGLLNKSDVELWDMANWVLDHYKDPLLQITQIVLEPHAEDTDGTMWQKVLGFELEDRITIKATPPGGGPIINQEAHIQGISHEIGTVTWRTTLDVSPADTRTYWVVGTSQLGTGTRLAA